MLTESELVRKERFERLYAERASAVLAYALRRASPEEAADAAAETFAVAWRRLDEMPAGWELAWLYGVARRVLATQRRAIGRQRAVVFRLAREERAVPGTGFDEVGEPVLEALAELDERDREVLMLTAWEGLSGREAAAALGCSDTVIGSGFIAPANGCGRGLLRSNRRRRELALWLLGRVRRRSHGEHADS